MRVLGLAKAALAPSSLERQNLKAIEISGGKTFLYLPLVLLRARHPVGPTSSSLMWLMLPE